MRITRIYVCATPRAAQSLSQIKNQELASRSRLRWGRSAGPAKSLGAAGYRSHPRLRKYHIGTIALAIISAST